MRCRSVVTSPRYRELRTRSSSKQGIWAIYGSFTKHRHHRSEGHESASRRAVLNAQIATRKPAKFWLLAKPSCIARRGPCPLWPDCVEKVGVAVPVGVLIETLFHGDSIEESDSFISAI